VGFREGRGWLLALGLGECIAERSSGAWAGAPRPSAGGRCLARGGCLEAFFCGSKAGFEGF
jgi:hypothetical protein